jgi:arginase
VTIVDFRQWQGAGRRALPASFDRGASLLLERFEAPVERFETPVDAVVPIGDDRQVTEEAGIVYRGSLLRQLRDATSVLGGLGRGPLLVIGGDCSVDLAPIARARLLDPSVTVVYFDAHADLNVPAESPSGALHGMVLRHLLGEGDPEFLGLLGMPTPAASVVLAGTRAFDDAEALYVSAHGIGRVRVEQINASMVAPGQGAVHVHLDLDVLDPAEFPHITWPEPGGPSVTALAGALGSLCETGRVGSIAITECIATRADHLDVLEPILDVVRDWLRVTKDPSR